MGHKDLRLGPIFYTLFFYNISFSWLLPLDGFQFIFLLRDSENDLLRNQTERSTGFVPFSEQKIQGLFKVQSYFQGPHSVRKRAMPFLVLPQHEQLYREGLSVFAPLGT